ncbi:MAG: hypothetical protein U5J98_01560 [Halobacteriales archaeon]|nr:hypothetical protein [Halobacteriales archaeon]
MWSTWIAERVTQAVQHAQDTLVSAGRIAEGALEVAAEDLSDSSLVKWLRANDVDIDSTEDGRMKLRFGQASTFQSTTELRDVLKAGYDAWIAAGRKRDRFREAMVRARVAGSPAILQTALPT